MAKARGLQSAWWRGTRGGNKDDVVAHTPDARKYHPTNYEEGPGGTLGRGPRGLMGAVIPRARNNGSSMGFDHEKAGVVIVDPDMPDSVVLDLSTLRNENTEDAISNVGEVGYGRDTDDETFDALTQLGRPANEVPYEETLPEYLVESLDGDEKQQPRRRPNPRKVNPRAPSAYVTPRSSTNGNQLEEPEDVEQDNTPVLDGDEEETQRPAKPRKRRIDRPEPAAVEAAEEPEQDEEEPQDEEPQDTQLPDDDREEEDEEPMPQPTAPRRPAPAAHVPARRAAPVVAQPPPRRPAAVKQAAAAPAIDPAQQMAALFQTMMTTMVNNQQQTQKAIEQPAARRTARLPDPAQVVEELQGQDDDVEMDEEPAVQPQPRRVPVPARRSAVVAPAVAEEEDEEDSADPFAALGINFLVGQGPVKPTRQVVFDLGKAVGTITGKYHEVIEGAGCIVLVYDTRYEDGNQFVPPFRPDAPITLHNRISKKEVKTYEVWSIGTQFAIGCFDCVVMAIHEDEAEVPHAGGGGPDSQDDEHE